MGEPFPEIDTTVPHVARTYDYLLGGTTNFEVDREFTERVSTVFPGGIAAGRAHVRGNRRFLRRVVRHLAAEVGVNQFLDIGSGLPTEDNVHEVAQAVAPDSRIVYVDNDSIVLAHAHQLLKSTAEGETAFLLEDLRNPDRILTAAAQTLDLDRPVAIMLISVLHSVGDSDDPYEVVGRLLDAVPPGSYLAISHLSSEIAPEAAELIDQLNRTLPVDVTDRGRAQVARFFEDLELIEPGITHIDDWRPEGETPELPDGPPTPWYGAVGRKP